MGAGGEPHALHICGKGGLTGSTRIMLEDPDRSEPIELSYREAVREALSHCQIEHATNLLARQTLRRGEGLLHG